MIDLGPFQLDAFVAGGGMGTVWRGRHRDRQSPVAIKVVNVPEGELATAVRVELEAMARLTHPHVVGLHGYGRIPAEVAPPGEPRLAAGSLWMAMELCDRGTLDDLHAMPWVDLQPVLLDLLGALAYAHARDVVHRDIKPSNVLLAGADRVAKLSDFGIAYALEKAGTAETPLHAGTPAYMPPEQETGDAILQGPWTDVFAFGVMVWKVVCGKYPWGDAAGRFLFRKMTEKPDKFEPRTAVPSDLEAWLRTCMRARAELRFATAADAAHALRGLAAVRGGVRRPTAERPVERPVARTEVDEAVAPTEVSGASGFRDPALHDPERPAGSMPGGQRPPPPPMHTDGLSMREVDSRGLVNAGLELLTLRERRTVGREAERERLWDALVRVRRTGRALAVVLEGPSGVGKTHLARALGRRASELGAAHAAWMELGDDGPTGGFAGLVRRLVRYPGADPEEARGAVSLLDPFFPPDQPDDTDVLVDALCPPPGATGDAGAMEAVYRLLRRMGAERPVVLGIDGPADVAPRVARFLDHLAARGLDVPVMLAIAAPLPADKDRAWVERIELRDLPEDDRVSFVRELLGLDPALAQRVARISEGNPGYAEQVVRSWAERGALEPGPSGFRIRKGARAPVPRSAFAAQAERVGALLDHNPSWARALELAGVLGVRVDPSLWMAALGPDRAHAEPLVAALVQAGLARREGDGWQFSTRAVCTAVVDRAQRAGTARAHHEALARVLRGGSDPDALARHLLGAGRFAEALDPLLAAMAAAHEQGRYPYVLELVDDWEKAAERAEIPPSDARRGQALIARAGALFYLFRKAELTETARDAAARAREHGWPDVEAAALVRLCWNSRVLSVDEQRAHLERAREVVEKAGLDGRRAEVHNALGHLALGRGHLEDALASFREATRCARLFGGRALHTCAGEEATTLTLLGRMDEATALALECDRLATEARSAWGRALAQHHLGQIEFLRGDYAAAEQAFALSGALCRRIGDGQEWYLRALVGLCARLRGELGRARRIFQECLDAPVEFGVLMSCCGMVSLAAPEEDWERPWFEIDRFLASGSCNAFMARTLAAAGDHAVEVGRPDRALRAWRAALTNHERLGNAEDAQELRAMVDRLGATSGTL